MNYRCWSCLSVGLLALSALLAKLLGLRLLASGVSESVPMAPSTACAFLFLAAALSSRLPWSTRPRACLSLLLPVFIIPLPAIAKLAAWRLGAGWGPVASAPANDPWAHVWVMSPLTALLFFVLGACVAGLPGRASSAGSRASAWGAAFSAAFSGIVLIGYAYRVPLFYGGPIYPMAATTAACFLIAATAVLSETGRGNWPWSLLEGDSPRAQMMRSFLPLSIGVILLMGLVNARADSSQSVLHSSVILLGSLLLTSWIVSKVSRSVGASIEATERKLSSSERLNRNLIANIPQSIFIKDLNSVYLFCNRNYAAGLGVEPGRIPGRDDFAFHPREEAERYLAADREVIASGRSLGVTERYERDGQERWLHTIKVPCRDEQGKVIGVLGIAEDISERKRAEAALTESQQLMASIVENVPEMIFLKDAADLRFVLLNRAGEELLGYDRKELLGKSDLDFFPPEQGAFFIAADRKVLEGEGGAIDIPEEPILTAKKGQRLLRTRKVCIRAADGSPKYLLGISEDITESKVAQAELERLKTAIEQASECIVITDLYGTILYVNPAVEKSTGYRREELLGKNPRLFKSGKHDQAFYGQLWETIAAAGVWRGRIINRRKDGTLVTAETTISAVHDASGQIVNYVAVQRDVSENIRLEEALRQAQKMESVGRLAGGVAHDFNNILTAINGYAGFALAGLPEGDQRRDDIKEILAAGERAARLTRQLLAFSRKQILNPEVLDINSVVGGMLKMLKRLLGEDVAFETRLAARACLARVDAGQIEQVFLNLAINARDAMPKGGTLRFETEIVAAEEAEAQSELPPGPLVCLSISDTGAGMSDAVKARLFEPFFTTKEKGKGTGLGLSTVYGIVKQSGGGISVESEPERGSRFRIYLPQAAAPPQARAADLAKEPDNEASLRGMETVLLVEDEEVIRRLGARALSLNGYRVLVAADGQQALSVLEGHGKAVDLLLTDVVMPGMSGRELARLIAAKKLAARTLFVSGFTDEAIVRHGVLEPGLAFMYKPFSPAGLLRKVRAVLDGPPEHAQA